MNMHGRLAKAEYVCGYDINMDLVWNDEQGRTQESGIKIIIENILGKLPLTLLKMDCFYPLLERTCNTCFNTSLTGCIGDILCGIFQEGRMISKVMA